MTTYVKHITLTFFTVAIVFTAYGQKNILQKSIYFEPAKFDLTNDSKTTLDILIDSLKNFKVYKIKIKGNTDNVGDTTYNNRLSQQRVNSTEEYLIAHGILQTVFSTVALGANKPIADNETDEGKQKNRRVDISIAFIRKPAIDSSQFLPSIWELYRQIERKPQEFCINQERDTALLCEKGTIVYIKANSFNVSDSCSSACVKIKIKETFLKSEMIRNNLSTTSNKKLIETQGMVYTDAEDCNSNKLKLIKGKELVIFLPTDSVNPNAKVFNGVRTIHDSIMNWRISKTSVLSNFTRNELRLCSELLCCDETEICDFWCKVKKFISNLFGQKRNSKSICAEINKAITLSGIKSKCDELRELFLKYDVRSSKELINKIESAYTSKSLSYADFKFYIYNTSWLGNSNIDAIAIFAKNEVPVTLKINIAAYKNVDCKLVFKKRRVIVPPTKIGNMFEFENVPKGENVTIVGVKYENGKPFLAMEQTTIDNKTIDMEFEELTVQELKEKLKTLDE
jgi:hypothetical protein